MPCEIGKDIDQLKFEFKVKEVKLVLITEERRNELKTFQIKYEQKCKQFYKLMKIKSDFRPRQ